MSSPAPYELLDDGYAPDPCDVLVVGCGNILRGDDAVGPLLVRELAERQARGAVPDGVRLVDGGTAGMDVAFGMRGAARVVLVDAARTGAEPGTLYRVPSSVVEDVPPLSGLHMHAFRWDHALSLASWLLGPLKPTDVTVFLVEAESFEPGAPLTDAVQATMARLADLLASEFWPVLELTAAGDLHLPAAVAAAYFPGGVCLASRVEHRLELMPLHDAAYGGLVLKQRNAAGDRSVLVSEVLGFPGRSAIPAGRHPSIWDPVRGMLVVHLDREAVDVGVRSRDAGGARVGPLGGLPAGDDPGRGREATARGLPDGGEGAAGGRRRTPHGSPPTSASP